MSNFILLTVSFLYDAVILSVFCLLSDALFCTVIPFKHLRLISQTDIETFKYFLKMSLMLTKAAFI